MIHPITQGGRIGHSLSVDGGIGPSYHGASLPSSFSQSEKRSRRTTVMSPASRWYPRSLRGHVAIPPLLLAPSPPAFPPAVLGIW